MIALVMVVFVHILIEIARPIIVCQTIKKVAGSPNRSMSNILCPFKNIVKKGTGRAKNPVINSPSSILSIRIKILFISNDKSPEIKQTK
ncbi:MAG: hypothetical protein IPM91_15720 [Bacteroidetes bacterium]|nr:hypothetical protein [Bacteroidota bacterium]